MPETKERIVKFSSDKHERLHKFLVKINEKNFTSKWFKSLDETEKSRFPFPLNTFENFKYEIGEYLWHTYINYGEKEVKIMTQQSKKFKSEDDVTGFFVFCMSIKPEPKPLPEPKESKREKEMKVIKMTDLDLFIDDED